MERSEVSQRFALGSALPTFSLQNVDGSKVSSDTLRGAPAALVVFTCNHCPYVKGSEAALNATIKRLQPRGLKVVAINSNDAAQYPEDGFEKMQQKAREQGLGYPYLYDADQTVAKLFDAQCTPECFLFDARGTLVFHGTINDSVRDPTKVTRDILGSAIEELLETGKVTTQFANPIGCSIKWKK